MKSEGAVVPPVFVHGAPMGRMSAAARPLPPSPPCEVCGTRVLRASVRPICPRCGFLGGHAD